MIELKNISYSYGNNAVLEGFDLELQANKLICLLGSSGCGKTTILRLIAGLETPQKGEVSIGNKCLSLNGKLLVEAHHRNIGFIFQDLALWPHFSVYKNIAFGLGERKAKNIKKTVFEMLEFFGLQEYANKFPHQLSGGQKQLVAISRSLVLKPEILLMDEPLANIDVKLKRRILEHIKSLRNEFNLSIIYVTHDHREAFAVADEVLVLNEGQIEDRGTIEQIKNSNNKFVKYFLEY
jgi:ABC-type Fe3+/spermidine/putrescine transport system ATPase subunit